MVNFLKKYESHGDKIDRVNWLNWHHQIYQFTSILFGAGVRCDRCRFSMHSPFIEKSMCQCIQL